MSGFDVDVRVDRKAGFRLNARFEAPPGISVVCGRSGCGKSSLLLAVLGALRPAAGRIAVAGRVLFDSAGSIDLPVRERRVGMVFQDAPLFPHLDTLRNVAFGLHDADRLAQARALLERVGAVELAARRPHELSGGERQRVALARSLAPAPAALLLDEPFSALDPAARDRLGDLLVELQQTTAIPFLHVTHDLGEAVRLGHHLVLLDGGEVAQSGPPVEVVARPATLAAARAVGTQNLYSGRVLRQLADEGCTEIDLGGTKVLTSRLELQPGSAVALGLRAEDVLISLEPLRQTSARNVISGTVERLQDRGAAVEVRVTTPVPVRVLVTPASIRQLRLEPGRQVWLLIKAASFRRLL